MLDADTEKAKQFISKSNAYPDPAPKMSGSGPRKTHRIYAPGDARPTVTFPAAGIAVPWPIPNYTAW